MMKKQIFNVLLLMALALFLAACGAQDSEDANDTEDTGSTEVAEEEATEEEAGEEEQSAERELLDLTIEDVAYDSENDALVLSVDTNLPEETAIYRAVLQDEEGNNTLIEYEAMVDEAKEIVFSLQGVDKAELAGKEYKLVFEFNVTEKTNSNLATDASLGGTFSEMDEAYQGSEQVEVKNLGDENTYSVVLVSSNANVVSEDLFAGDEEEAETEEE